MALLAGLALVAIAGQAVSEPFTITLATKIAILAIAGIGLNIALGLGGLISLGHAAFFGAGGYVVAILSSHAQAYEPFLTQPIVIEGTTAMLVLWPLAILIGALAAAAIGALSLRSSGVYFIMITLAFAQMLYYFAISWPAYGGEDGLPFPIRNSLPGLNTLDPLSFFAVCFVLLCAVIWGGGTACCVAVRAGPAVRTPERRAARERRPFTVPDPLDRVCHFGCDHRLGRRAVRRPQPLRQPRDAVVADIG